MKKVIILLTFMLLVVAVNAQSRGRIKTLAVDTMQGNNTTVLGTIPITGSYEQLYIGVTMVRISTAAGGTLYLQAGLDSDSKITLNSDIAPSVEFAANDTMATTDVATQYWNINVTEPGAANYFILGDGDVNDTVQVTTRYMLK